MKRRFLFDYTVRPGGRTELRLSRPLKTVSHAPDGFDHLTGGSQFFSQGQNLYVHGTIRHGIIGTMNRGDDLVPGEYHVRVGHEEKKYGKFRGGQIQGRAV
jgi:hypothetical protein